ncbi:MAG: AMP-binding protein [Acidimicrobiales bacterium]
MLGTVGEPINPEAWMWYHRNIGGERRLIVDTWWQTETGGHMNHPAPRGSPPPAGTATTPDPGVAEVVDDAGHNRCRKAAATLTLTRPWPSMLRGIWGDEAGYRDTYWSTYEGATSPVTALGSRTATSGCSAASTT